jgi:cytochrome c oxidase subunit 3
MGVGMADATGAYDGLSTLPVAEQFGDAKQQHTAGRFGMWLFLTTELLLFGGLFLAAAIIAARHPEWAHRAAQRLDWQLGGINTVLLIGSSFVMSIAILALRQDRGAIFSASMVAAGSLGLVFLGVKAFEYWTDYRQGLMPFLRGPSDAAGADDGRLWFDLYYTATGLHAVHLSVGIGLVFTLVALSRDEAWRRSHRSVIEVSGLYWQFIDFIWLLLYPTLYLAGR